MENDVKAYIYSQAFDEGYEKGYQDGRQEATVDVAPVIHAHWELYEDGWYCTNCELYAPFDCDPEEKGVPYCPNCGAKMDEEVE